MLNGNHKNAEVVDSKTEVERNFNKLARAMASNQISHDTTHRVHSNGNFDFERRDRQGLDDNLMA